MEDDEHEVYISSSQVRRILGPPLLARNRAADHALAPERLAQAEERLAERIREAGGRICS